MAREFFLPRPGPQITDPQTTWPRSTGFGVLMMEHTFCTKKKKKKSAQEVSCSSPVHRESVLQNDTNPRTNITHMLHKSPKKF